ncbi:MAG: hypothetical protein RL732_709 [Bacteroidota bacterium]
MWTGYSLKKKMPDTQGFWDRARKASVEEVLELIGRKYVDAVNPDSLNETAIDALVKELDPHSVYIPAEFTQEANEELKGHFEGIGVEYLILDDTLHVVQVLPGGPSLKAGVQLGDRIIKVGDSIVAGKGITGERIKKLLRGPSGTPVTVTIRRDTKDLTITIIRGNVPRPAVDAAYLIDSTTAFLHINKFSSTTYEEMMKALEELQQKGMKKLILDLRGNSGGLLEEAVDIADEFLDGNRMILYTEGQNSPREEYKCKRPGLFEKGPLVVLVDEFSASASEVLAGALQDWDRATVIGRRTFGKGLVQQAFELENGAELRLTVARYYTPTGRNIQKPYTADHDAYESEIFLRYHHSTSADSPQAAPQKVFKTLEKKRTVYGGGGITPDITVPFDTASLGRPVSGLVASNMLREFVYRFAVKEKHQWEKLPSAKALGRSFFLLPAQWQELIKTAARSGIDLQNLSPLEQENLQQVFKEQLALQLWGTEGFYELSNETDAFVKQARSTLH